jgi:uncharacterized protein YyaL (SSP411 family)
MKFTNRLGKESSPYLLQHSRNPVEWFPWGKEAFEKAQLEDKLLLISVGYSSCHWCHVMEHESFENQEVAEVMNAYFVAIKIDREERPDIDAIYMEAVQLMTGRGGWPLNCFALPDGRPIYGGTYFPKENWISILKQLNNLWKTDRQKTIDYAEELSNGIAQKDLIESNLEIPDWSNLLTETIGKWKLRLDNVEGGPAKAPKFPLPGDYIFLLRQAIASEDETLLRHVHLTLKKMAFGGIFDQIGGGFSRYSVDGIWKVPHFEKMLYDNGQLIQLYAEAYQQNRNPLYKEILQQTIEWLCREMLTEEGGFYAALDADSEGEEGKFYVWEKEQLELALGEDFKIVETYYNVNDSGYWEDGNYILLRKEDDSILLNQLGLNAEEFSQKLLQIKSKLLEIRSHRIRPGLDDKQLFSWNALACIGLCKAYEATFEGKYKELAERNMSFLLQKLKTKEGGVFRTYKNGLATISGFLDDYAFGISALLQLFQITGKSAYITEALELWQFVETYFSNPSSPLFFYTSSIGERLIVRRTEYMDNVTPAANSELAKSLFLLGRIIGNSELEKRAIAMVNCIAPAIVNYGSAFSNWCQLIQWLDNDFKEIVITGPNSANVWMEISANYLPFSFRVFQDTPKDENNLSIFEGRFNPNETLIYVCENQSCKLPVRTSAEVLTQVKPIL